MPSPRFVQNNQTFFCNGIKVGVHFRSERLFYRSMTTKLLHCKPTFPAAPGTGLRVLVILALIAVPVMASPWVDAVDKLRADFTGPIARGLSLVAIVIGGLTFAFGESDAKRLLAGIVFGVGMSVAAVNFMAWLFP